MNPQLEARIREVYPTGKLSEPNESAYFGSEYGEKTAAAVNRAIDGSGIRFEGEYGLGREGQFHVAFTSESYPDFSSWIGASNLEKLSWISDRGHFYPVLWLNVSRIYPVWFRYYNIWQPRGSTGYLDAVIENKPFDEMWSAFELRLKIEFEQCGIHPLNETEKLEKTWVTDEEYTDESGRDLPDDEVRLERVNIWTCLFPQ